MDPNIQKRLLFDHEGGSSLDQYAVLGNPIQHSLSPFIHRLFAEQTQQAIHYSAILVPLPSLSTVLMQFQAEQGKGVNITLPFKELAYPLVDSHTERATLAQAINTIRFHEDGSRIGDNTDGIGLINDFKRQGITLTGKKILMLGAGGAVRGILAPLMNEKPYSLVIANRSENKAIDLAKSFSHLGNLVGCLLTAVIHGPFDIIINAISSSAFAQPHWLHASTFCYDLSYGKNDTPFLRLIKQQGVHFYSDGLGMLVEQAAESFYFWRSVKPATAPVFNYLQSLRETH